MVFGLFHDFTIVLRFKTETVVYIEQIGFVSASISFWNEV